MPPTTGVPSEPALPDTALVPAFCNTMVPVVIAPVLCGVHVIWLPETQYEYGALSTVTTLSAVL
jgi:hypothetical protein